MTRSGNTYYYHYDGLGSVTEITNSAGSTVESCDCDIFGNSAFTTSLIGNRYRFTGREFDEETGLYHYRARAYSPTIGRFLQRDPIGYYDSMNLFAYVGNSSVNYIDPWGLMEILMKAPTGPKPSGWTPEWVWRYPARSTPKTTPRWFDPKGGEWRWHEADKWHKTGHWDYNAWDKWNSEWQNIDPSLIPPIPNDSDKNKGDCEEPSPEPDWEKCLAEGSCA